MEVYKRRINDSGKQGKKDPPHEGKRDLRGRKISVADFQFKHGRHSSKNVGVAEFDFPEEIPQVAGTREGSQFTIVMLDAFTIKSRVKSDQGELQKNLHKISEKLQTSESEHEKLSLELRRLNKAYNEMLCEKENVDTQLIRNQRQMDEKDLEIQHVKRHHELQLQRNKLEIEECAIRIKKLQDLKNVADTETEELRNRLTTVEKHYQSSMTQNKELVLESRDKDLTNERLKEKIKELMKYNEEIDSKESEKSKKLKKQISELNMQLDSIVTTKHRDHLKNQKLEKEIRELTGIIEGLTSSNKKENEAEFVQMLRQVQEKDSEIEHLQRQIKLNADRNSLERNENETRIKKLEDLKNVSETEAEELRNRLKMMEQHYQTTMTQNEELVMKSRQDILETEKLKTTIEDLTQKLESKRSEELQKISRLEEQLDVLMSRRTDEEKENQNLVQEISRLSQSREDLITSSMHQLKKQETEGEVLKSQLDSMKAELDLQKAESERVQEELNEMLELKKKFEQTDTAKLYKLSQQQKEKIDMGTKALSDMQNKIEMLTNTNQHLRSEIKDLASEKSAMKDSKMAAETELADLQSKYMRAVQLAMEQEQYVVIEDRHLTRELSKRRSQLLLPGVTGFLDASDISEGDLSTEFKDIESELKKLGADPDHQPDTSDYSDAGGDEMDMTEDMTEEIPHSEELPPTRDERADCDIAIAISEPVISSDAPKDPSTMSNEPNAGAIVFE